MKKSIFFMLLILFSLNLFSQEFYELIEMSIEDLLKVKIVSASKKEESIFDAPLSSTVITYDEIIKCGANSIPEALRLVPGLIVREQTPGNFDIHLRGFDNIPPGTNFANMSNSITLVMIDNRPVYNYFTGGTFWETLPISLADVEKIEVVRGPSSSLYGPNATAGVINIITKKPNNTLNINSNLSYGNSDTRNANLNLSYGKNKFKFGLSGNYGFRERFDTKYYSWYKKDYTDSFDSIKVMSSYPYKPFPNIDERYPNKKLATDKFGINSYSGYLINDKINLELTSGYQNSQVQKIYVDNFATPITTSSSKTSYVNFMGKIYDLSLNSSILFGEQTPAEGIAGWKYKMKVINTSLEYDYNVFKEGKNNLSLRPGIGYQSAIYDDSEFIDVSKKAGFINGEKILSNYSFSFKADYSTNNKLRLIAALREDKYNKPDKFYMSYQFVAMYKFNENNLVRAVYSRANRGPFMMDTYSSYTINKPSPYYSVFIQYLGNEDLDLVTFDMVELGYRSKINKNIQLDFELFYNKSKNYNDFEDIATSSPDTSFHGMYLIRQYKNQKVTAGQKGITGNLFYVFSKKLQFKFFLTYQKTDLKDAKLKVNNTYQLFNIENKSTPKIFGGFYVNYLATQKLNINLNGYYFSDFTASEAFGTEKVDGKFLLNSKISYNVYNGLNLYFNARNLINDSSKEFIFADKIKGLYSLGISYDL